MADLVQSRSLLAEALRQLRREAGLTSRQLADKCGWLPSKVTQIETAAYTPTAGDIDTWSIAVGNPYAAPALREQLAELESFYRDWRRQSASGVRFIQRRWLDLESGARKLSIFEPHFVPGLLQTADYARERLLAHAHLNDAPDDVEEAVETRLMRQRALRHPDRRFHFIIAEFGLRSGAYAPPDMMTGQIDKIISTSHENGVRIGILPIGSEWKVNVDHGFWIFDSEFVLVETVTAELRLEQPNELTVYQRVFEMLAERAVYDREAEEILATVRSDIAARR